MHACIYINIYIYIERGGVLYSAGERGGGDRGAALKPDGEINPEQRQEEPDLVSDLSQGNTQAVAGSCRAQVSESPKDRQGVKQRDITGQQVDKVSGARWRRRRRRLLRLGQLGTSQREQESRGDEEQGGNGGPGIGGGGHGGRRCGGKLASFSVASCLCWSLEWMGWWTMPWTLPGIYRRPAAWMPSHSLIYLIYRRLCRLVLAPAPLSTSGVPFRTIEIIGSVCNEISIRLRTGPNRQMIQLKTMPEHAITWCN